MFLIVFLGNPGKKYEKTRHNAGWLFAEYLKKKWGLEDWKEEKKFFGEICKIPLAPFVKEEENSKKESPLDKGDLGDFLFLKPKTFMNLSGKSVLAAQQFYKIPLENILVIYDDKDQMFGNIKYKQNGSAGGQNGVKDILQKFGTQEISRIKIGVDNAKRTEFNIPTADFVLSNFSEEEVIFLEKEIFPAVEEKLRNWCKM